MTSTGDTWRGFTPAIPPILGADGELEAYLGRLEAKNAALGRELDRCRSQLQLVFDVTQKSDAAADPEALQDLLLQHAANLLDADAVYLDLGGCCTHVAGHSRRHTGATMTAEALRSALATHVDGMRLAPRAAVPGLSDGQRHQVRDAHVLLASLPRAEGEVGVVIVVRAASRDPFNDADRLALDTLLAYGSQLMSHVASVRRVQRTAVETVCALVNAIDAKDNYTSDHSERVSALARLLGQSLGLPHPRIQVLEWAGMLHDVGKIGVAEEILNKPGVLTPSEMAQMRRHPEIGYDVLKPVGQFEPVLDAVLYHHENHDGSGYPRGLAGERIPIEARIVHIVDIFDALTMHRPYRRGFSIERALTILKEDAGRVTDPEITRAFIEHLPLYLSRSTDSQRRILLPMAMPSGNASPPSGTPS